jgi:hypothetical protein
MNEDGTVERIKTKDFMYNKFFLKIVPFMMQKKCGRAKQATNDDITLRMRTACWMKTS